MAPVNFSNLDSLNWNATDWGCPLIERLLISTGIAVLLHTFIERLRSLYSYSDKGCPGSQEPEPTGPQNAWELCLRGMRSQVHRWPRAYGLSRITDRRSITSRASHEAGISFHLLTTIPPPLGTVAEGLGWHPLGRCRKFRSTSLRSMCRLLVLRRMPIQLPLPGHAG